MISINLVINILCFAGMANNRRKCKQHNITIQDEPITQPGDEPILPVSRKTRYGYHPYNANTQYQMQNEGNNNMISSARLLCIRKYCSINITFIRDDN